MLKILLQKKVRESLSQLSGVDQLERERLHWLNKFLERKKHRLDSDEVTFDEYYDYIKTSKPSLAEKLFSADYLKNKNKNKSKLFSEFIDAEKNRPLNPQYGTLNNLPVDNWLHIASYLDPPSLVQWSRTSHGFYVTLKNKNYWQEKLLDKGCHRDAFNGVINLVQDYKNLYRCFSSLPKHYQRQLSKPWELVCLSGELPAILSAIQANLMNTPTCNPYNGNTPLHYATVSGKPEAMAQIVFSLAIDPGKTDYFSKTCLHVAAAQGCCETMQYAKKQLRQDPRQINLAGTNALLSTFASGKQAACELALREWKLDKGNQNQNGLNALLYAAMYGHKNLMRYATNTVGNAPDSIDIHGANAFHIACFSGNQDAIDFSVNELRLDPLSTDNLGKTGLHFAMKGGHIEAVRYLATTFNLDPYTLDSNGTNNLHFGSMSDNENMIHFAIIELGLDSHSVDEIGANALLHATISRNPRNLLAALHFGLELTSKDNEQTDLLHYCGWARSIAIPITVRILAHQKNIILDPYQTDNHGKTAFDYAKENTLPHLRHQIAAILTMPIEKLMAEAEQSGEYPFIDFTQQPAPQPHSLTKRF